MQTTVGRCSRCRARSSRRCRGWRRYSPARWCPRTRPRRTCRPSCTRSRRCRWRLVVRSRNRCRQGSCPPCTRWRRRTRPSRTCSPAPDRSRPPCRRRRRRNFARCMRPLRQNRRRQVKHLRRRRLPRQNPQPAHPHLPPPHPCQLRLSLSRRPHQLRLLPHRQLRRVSPANRPARLCPEPTACPCRLRHPLCLRRPSHPSPARRPFRPIHPAAHPPPHRHQPASRYRRLRRPAAAARPWSRQLLHRPPHPREDPMLRYLPLLPRVPASRTRKSRAQPAERERRMVADGSKAWSQHSPQPDSTRRLCLAGQVSPPGVIASSHVSALRPRLFGGSHRGKAVSWSVVKAVRSTIFDIYEVQKPPALCLMGSWPQLSQPSISTVAPSRRFSAAQTGLCTRGRLAAQTRSSIGLLRRSDGADRRSEHVHLLNLPATFTVLAAPDRPEPRLDRA